MDWSKGFLVSTRWCSKLLKIRSDLLFFLCVLETGKPGVTKGGQLAMSSDASRCRPRTYKHRHSDYERPIGFTAQGPNEVRMLAGDLAAMVSKADGDGKIFREPPHLCCDNFFSGDAIMDHLGSIGFGATMTCRRDRLPKGVPKHYWHHLRTGSDKVSKAARFIPPITAVKTTYAEGGKLGYTRAHVSFQSTGPTNISTVNALNSNSLFVVKKERGRGSEKRKWAVEMNDARLIYLSNYGMIDTIDSRMASQSITYRSWKYWHSPALHALTLAIATAYDMYLECAEGNLDASWKMSAPDHPTMTFHQFQDRLSEQMLRYKPSQNQYSGDSAFRSSSSLHKTARIKTQSLARKRKSNKGNTRASVGIGGDFCIGQDDFNAAKRRKRIELDPTELAQHFRSFLDSDAQIKSGAKCAWCSLKTYTRCTICKVPLHNFPARGVFRGASCSLDWHNSGLFGLGYLDSISIPSKAGVNWSMPSREAMKANVEHMKELAKTK